MYNYICMKYVPFFLILFFIKLLFSVIEIIIVNNNVKTLKIIKKVIFALFVLEKNQIWKNVKSYL